MLGLLWLALFSTRLRWLGVAPALVGLLLAAAARPPDVYVGPDGRTAAVRGPDGRLRVIGLRFASFAADEWLAADGDARNHRDRSVTEGVWCDASGCTAPLPDGRRLALDWSHAALRADCGRAAIIVTRLAAPADCRGNSIVIDGTDLAARGAVTLTFTPDGIRQSAARPAATDRRWYNRPAPPPPVPNFAGTSAQPAADEGNDEIDELDLSDPDG